MTNSAKYIAHTGMMIFNLCPDSYVLVPFSIDGYDTYKGPRASLTRCINHQGSGVCLRDDGGSWENNGSVALSNVHVSRESQVIRHACSMI